MLKVQNNLIGNSIRLNGDLITVLRFLGNQETGVVKYLTHESRLKLAEYLKEQFDKVDLSSRSLELIDELEAKLNEQNFKIIKSKFTH